MKAFRGAVLSVLVATGLATIVACGNPFEGDADGSGSVVRVVNVTPDPSGAFAPDAVEPEIPNSFALVQMTNVSRPNVPDGVDNDKDDEIDEPDEVESTNSFVTMSRYRVEFTGIGVDVNISPIDGGQTVGIAPDGIGTMRVLVMDQSRRDQLRRQFPSVAMALRASVTIRGEDAFGDDVKTTVDVTLALEN